MVNLKSMPSVSVIIPTFNRAHCIREAIHSVLIQSYPDFEIIVVDDGSTDDTETIVRSYESNVSYVYQENRGPSAARNSGIQRARGTYLCFLDSDDLWLKNKLKAQMELIRRSPEVKVCYTDEIWIRNGVRVNQRKIHRKYSGWIFRNCLPLCIISPSSVLLHREVFDIIGLFDENLMVCEDYDLWLRVSCRFPITFIDKPLIIKQGGHPDQLSRKFWGMDRFRVIALEKILKICNLDDEDRKAAEGMLKKKSQILAEGCLKRGKGEEYAAYQKIFKKFS